MREIRRLLPNQLEYEWFDAAAAYEYHACEDWPHFEIQSLNGQYTIPHMIDQFGHAWRQDLHALGILFINRKLQDTPAIFAAQLAEFFSVILTESNQIDMALKRIEGQIHRHVFYIWPHGGENV